MSSGWPRTQEECADLLREQLGPEEFARFMSRPKPSPEFVEAFREYHEANRTEDLPYELAAARTHRDPDMQRAWEIVEEHELLPHEIRLLQAKLAKDPRVDRGRPDEAAQRKPYIDRVHEKWGPPGSRKMSKKTAIARVAEENATKTIDREKDPESWENQKTRWEKTLGEWMRPDRVRGRRTSKRQ